jgi:phenylalanyl-tRNA synthetase beta chain
MRLPLEWVEELVPGSRLASEVAERLTLAGLPCELARGVEFPEGIVTARIRAVRAHPSADRLKVCTVDFGGERPSEIVCGAPNAREGAVAVLALPGTELANGLKIEKQKLRGVLSEGMLLSEEELGISSEASGILLLPETTALGRPLAEVLPHENALVTEVPSNRGDCMSVEGTAREIAAVFGSRLERVRPKTPLVAPSAHWKIAIENPSDCPRYGARVIAGLTPGPSPEWLSRRLAACGVRPILNVIDATNYVFLELGHPLHAFDAEKLAGRTVAVRRARKGESLTTLDGVARELSPPVLVIADDSGPIALAGIMGGEATMVTETTRRVFLEGASFEAHTVRQGSRHLKFATDASARFERRVDPESVGRALDRCVELLLSICPGSHLTDFADSYPAPAPPRRIGLRRATLARILGVEPPAEETGRILERLDIAVTAATDLGWEALPPSFRSDLSEESDLVEEVGRIWGYERVPERALIHASAQLVQEESVESFWRARRVLLSLGLSEVVTPSLVSGADEHSLTKGHSFFFEPVRLLNPLSSDRDALRGSLVPSLLEVLARNHAHSVADLGVFEVGRVFGRATKGALHERLRAGVLLAGLGASPTYPAGRPCDFFDMKGLLEVYVERSWGARLEVGSASSSPLKPSRSAEAVAGGRAFGVFGEIGEAARKRFDLPKDLPVVVAEWDLETHLVDWSRAGEFIPLPRFPAVLRDLAFVVPKTCRAAALEAALREKGGEYLAEIRLFDVYEGEQLGHNEKSLAFALIFRSPERSLKNEEIDRSIEQIIDHAKRTLAARIR